MQGVPAAYVHASGDTADAQELVLSFEQRHFSARLARPYRGSYACTTPTNDNDLGHEGDIPFLDDT